MNTQNAIGRYEVLEELGHGAMGTVYRAKDPAMDRIVALKTIRSEVLAGQQGGEFRERFYREARAAGALAHPGIVPVFDVGEHEGLPFLVMEFINGRTLADAAKGGERLPLERVCEIGQQIAEALGYAHKNGVVHRDIKAANILLTSRESYGIERPKITDFGVAKLATVQITTTGQMLGTPAYMPPEQFTGGPIDGRTDLFSLGVILYWMVTGEHPFPGESLVTVSYKVMHTEPVPPRKLNPAVPEALDRVILKCLAKNPADRYQTGEELARDLSAVRAAGTGPRSAPSAAAALGSDPQATLDQSYGSAAQGFQTPAAQPEEEPAPARPALATIAGTKWENRVLLGVVGALAIAVAGLYVLQNRNRGVVPAPAPTAAAPAATETTAQAPAAAATVGPATPAAIAQPTTAPPAASAPVAAAAPPPAQPSAAPPAVAAPPAAAAPPVAPRLAPAPAAADAGPREPAAVDFDPRALNPDVSARLRIDAERVPPNADFFVVMDGKIYFHRSEAGFRQQYDDLYLPPGVHEFRVRSRVGTLLKLSNIVSADFQARRRLTLRIEVRIPPGLRGAGATPQQIAAASQLYVTLR
jgi:serine/threonine-protein kinase